jgi:GNAT superfamily N-acetyltransferase
MKIEHSDDKSLSEIIAWLLDEYDEDRGIGFYGNRRRIEQVHANRELMIIRESGETVAFAFGTVYFIEILVVRPDRRRLGYGRAFAEYWITRARRQNVCKIVIECKPATSIPFWEKMGFKLDQDTRETRILGGMARLTLERSFKLPKSNRNVASVHLEFFPEPASYTPGIPPACEYRPRAVRLDSRKIQFDRRVIFPQLYDVVVRITVDDKELYCDKAKYKDAAVLGVKSSPDGALYLDSLTT